jgi:hypothetical protein
MSIPYKFREAGQARLVSQKTEVFGKPLLYVYICNPLIECQDFIDRFYLGLDLAESLR